jgi:threonine/homoserine/homoserine lactone efflux protein
MNENRLMQQIGTIFGVFMTFFYLGVGFFLILSPNLRLSLDQTYNKFMRILVGSTFIVYGIYRAYRTYVKIVELFFSGNDDKD